MRGFPNLIFRQIRCICLVLPISACLFVSTTSAEERKSAISDLQRFWSELDDIRRSKLERKTAIKRYESLIDRSASGEGAAVAMIEVARLYESNRDSAQRLIGNSAAEATKWYRRSYSQLPAGNPLRLEAGLGLATILQSSADDGKLAEARQILETVESEADDDPLALMRVKSSFVRQLLAEGKFDEAESVCRKLLAVDARLSSHLKSDDVGGAMKAALVQLKACQLNASLSLFNALVNRPITLADKERWLADFEADFGDRPWLQADLQLTSQQIQTGDQILSSSEATNSRNWILIVNAVVCVTLFVAVVVRRWPAQLSKLFVRSAG